MRDYVDTMTVGLPRDMTRTHISEGRERRGSASRVGDSGRASSPTGTGRRPSQPT